MTGINDLHPTPLHPTPLHPTPLHPTPLHPTPQLRRTQWQEINGSWGFAYDDDDQGMAEHWFEADHELPGTITVLFPPESEASGIGDTSFHRILWYRRTANIPHLDQERGGADERVLLHFGAVDYAAIIFVNGARVGSHRGGMTPFTIDVTDHLLEGDDQAIVVRVEDDPQDVAQPRGKQDWRTTTHGIFYERTSGIWQSVWWERVPTVHVTDLYWTSDLAAGVIGLEVSLSARPVEPTWIEVVVSNDAEPLAEQRIRMRARTQSVQLAVAALRMPMERGRLLWSSEKPTLLDAEVRVLNGAETKVSDRVESYLGLRSVGFADGRFTLNGHPYYLRMVLEQGYWPSSHLAAPLPDALRAEVELIKALGFNGARLHQKVEDPRFLYWCDRLGLAVWGEMANAFVFTTEAIERLVAEWMDVVRRDRSHPSVVAWIPLNESWGVPEIAEQQAQQHLASSVYHLTKALDPHRPAVSNEGWEHTQSDIWGVHDYTPDAQSIRERYGPDNIERTLTDRSPGRRRVLLDESDRRGQPMMITEFGGLSFAPRAGDNWFGYSTIDSIAEFAKRLDELVSAMAEQPDLAGFCYTQLTDTLQEANGLVHADRTPKLPVEDVRQIISQPSRAIPAEVIDAYRRAAVTAADDDKTIDEEER